jgi:hypothetical protein
MSARSLTAVPKPPAPVAKPVDPAVSQRTAVVEPEPASFEASSAPREHFASTALRPQLVPPREKIRITDEDEARAIVTNWLVRELAPLLGLDPSRVEIHVDNEAESRVAARGATGLMEDGKVFLHPARFRPSEPSGRELIAHELAHVAQRNASALAGETTRQAETEAAAIGRRFGQRRSIARPRVRLTSWIAADADASQADVDVAVAEARRDEIVAIDKPLNPTFWVSDGDVDEILYILRSVEPPVARGILHAVGNINPKNLVRLVDNISKSHRKNFRAEVLLCYEAVTTDEIRAHFDEDLLKDMDLGNLNFGEALAVDHTFSGLTEDARKSLLKTNKGPAIVAIRNLIDNSDAKSRWQTDQQSRLNDALKEEKDLRNDRNAYQKLLDSKNPAEKKKAGQLEEIAREVKKKLGGLWISDRDAVDAIDLLKDLDNSDLRVVAELLVNEKEATEHKGDDKEPYRKDRDYLRELIENFPDRELYDEKSERRAAFMRLLTYRPGYRNLQLAIEHTPRGVLFGAFSRVSSRDAYLAFQLVKALPPKARQAFMESEHWGVVRSEMSTEQLEGATTNFYTGGNDQEDRNSLLGQLLDDATWTNFDRLSGVLRMAVAAGNYEWVFTESLRRYVQAEKPKIGAPPRPDPYENKKLLGIIEKFKLYNPGVGRLKPDPQYLKPNGWWQEGVTGAFGRLGSLIDFIAHSKKVGLSGGQGLDLSRAQNAAFAQEYFAGIRFETQDKLGDGGARAEKTKEGVNYADAQYDSDEGLLTVKANWFELAALRYQVGDLTIQAGPSSLRKIDITLRFPSKKKPQQRLVNVQLGSVVLNDLLLINPGSMTAINRLELKDLSIVMIPNAADETPLPPLEAGLGFLFKPGAPLDAVITLGSVETKGVTTSGGTFVRSAKIENLRVGAGSAVTYIGSLQESVKRLDGRLAQEGSVVVPQGDEAASKAHAATLAQLNKQRDAAQREIDKIHGVQVKIKELEHRKGDPNGDFKPEDDKELSGLKASVSGSVLDIGSVEIQGADGLPLANGKFKDIHGQGGPAAAVFNLFGDPGTFSRLVEGRTAVEGVNHPDGKFTIDIGHIEVPDVRIKGKLPKVEEAEEDLSRFLDRNDPLQAGYEERLKTFMDRVDNARIYQAGLKNGVASLKDDKARADFLAARRTLDNFEADNALRIKSVTLDGAQIEAGSDGTIALRADKLEAAEILNPKTGMRVGVVHSDNFRVEGGLDKGVLGISDWRKNLKSGEISADQLTVTDYVDPDSGMGAKSISVKKLAATAKFGAATSANVQAQEIEATGISVAWTERLLLNQQTRLEGKATPTRAEKKQLADVTEILAGIAHENEAVDEAEAILKDEKAPARDREKAAKQKELAVELLEHWRRRAEFQKLVVTGLNVDISTEVDVRDEKFKTGDATKKGIKVIGKGPDGQIISGATLTKGSLRSEINKESSVEEVKLGPVRGGLTYSDDKIVLTNFGLDEIGLTNFAFLSPESTIWGSYTTTVRGVKISGQIDTPLVNNKAEDGERYTSKITIASFHLDEIEAGELHYRDDATKLHLQISKGKLKTIDASNLIVDLPKGDEKTKIHGTEQGGKASVGSLEDARAAASNATGTAFTGVVNARTLDIGIASDGTKDFDLKSLLIDGKLTQTDVDLKINAVAKGIQATLKDDALTEIRASDLSAKLKGKAKGAKDIDVSLDHLDTGKVTIDGDFINMPALRIPRVALNKINYADDKYKLVVPDGGVVAVDDAEADIVIQRYPEPRQSAEDEAAGKKKPERKGGFKSIVIQKFNVPLVTARGLKFTHIGKGVRISLPEDQTGFIKGIALTPCTGGFRIDVDEKADKYNLFGSVGVDTLNLAKFAAGKVNNEISATTDIDASTFRLDFLGAGKFHWTLEEIEATNFEAILNKLKPGESAATSRFYVDGAGNAKPSQSAKLKSVGARKLSGDDEGNVNLDEDLVAKGFIYEDLATKLTIKVAEARLREKPRVKDGKILVPKASITKAEIAANDIQSMLEKGGEPAKKGDYDNLDEFLSTLNGRLMLNINAPTRFRGAPSIGLRQQNFPLQVPIIKGQIDYKFVHDQLLTWPLSGLLVFSIEGGRGDASFSIHVRGKDALREFKLNPNEYDLAQKNRVKVLTLLTPYESTGDARKRRAAAADPAEAKRQEEESPIIADEITVTEATGHLSFFGNSATKLKDGGVLHMGAGGRDAVSDLHIQSVANNVITMGIGEVNAWIENLTIGSVKLNTGWINIPAIDDARLTLDNLKPKTFTGTVDSAAAENIVVDLN